MTSHAHLFYHIFCVKFRVLDILILIVSILLIITWLIILISLLILRAPLKTAMARWAPSLNIAIIIIIIIIFIIIIR